MSKVNEEQIRKAVKDRYGDIARTGGSGCCDSSEAGEKKSAPLLMYDKQAFQMGYSSEDLSSVPDGANLNLGCGNPGAIAGLKPGETVLDLGSGAGFDSFLAANKVGPSGRVIGVDMTPDMISRARENAEKGSYQNVEFRQGEIEDIPVEDNIVDVILSNCVINLSTDKPSVFREAYRVLKPGGRLAISDIVATAEIPEEIRGDLALYSACVSGALLVTDLEKILAEAGFRDIQIKPKDESQIFIREWDDEIPLEEFIQSATIEARK
jgi:SAM-dependent methyltransferase